jgi:RimJ/RimL family protein N-acetyltransferase
VATLVDRLRVAKWSIELRPRPDVSLRPLRPHEVSDRYVAGINNPVVARFLIARREGKLRKESISAFVQKDWEASDAMLFGIFVDGSHCGNVRLHAITAETAQIGVAVFDVAVHGRGVGSTALAAVATYAVRELGTATITAGIDRNNVASRKAFAAAGFRCVVDDPGEGGFIWHYP